MLSLFPPQSINMSVIMIKGAVAFATALKLYIA